MRQQKRGFVYDAKEIAAEAERGEYTEFVYDTTCFGEPAEAESAEDIAAGIERAMALEARPVFSRACR